MEKTCKCNLCDKEFSSPARLNAHNLSRHAGIRPVLKKNVKCGMCDYKCSTQCALKNHMRTHTGERPFKCTVDECGLEFKQLSHLQDHIKYKHSDERSFLCLYPRCRFTAKTSTGLRQHKTAHSDDRPFPCPHIGCHFRAKLKWHIQNHVTSIHSEFKAFACNECEYRAAHNYALKEHMRRHSTRREFKCNYPQCTESFKNSRDLKRHFGNRHGQRNIQCDHPGCELKYASRKALSIHKYSAHSKRSLTCPHPDCNYHTNLTSSLASHMIVHDGLYEGIPCTIKGCQFKGKNSRSLKTHMRRHKTLFKCPVSSCNRFASSEQALNKHIKSHSTVDRPFKCPLCWKHYRTHDHLKRHTLSHTNEKPFKCGHCQYGSSNRLLVKNHASSMHASQKFPFILVPLHDRECLRCKVTLPFAEFLVHSMTHAVPIVVIQRLDVK